MLDRLFYYILSTLISGKLPFRTVSVITTFIRCQIIDKKYILVNLFCANQNLLCKKNNGYFYFILWQNSSFECGVF